MLFRSGNALTVTDVTLDRFVDRTGFADALRKVGWLEGRDGALTFPRFAEHNGQTAKKRAETQARVAKHRNAKTVTPVTREVLPEKRREEKKDTTPNGVVVRGPPQSRFVPPTLADVAAYCRSRGNAVDPQRWLDHYSSNGWKVGRNPMKDWQAAVRTWEKNNDGQSAGLFGKASRSTADANNDAGAEYLRRKEAELAGSEAGEFFGSEGTFDR